MADYTDNYNLKLPEAEEYYNVEDFNDNAKIIDKQMYRLGQFINRHTDEIEDAVDRVGELERKSKGYYLVAVSGFGSDSGYNNSPSDFVLSADKVLNGTAMQNSLNSFIESVPTGSILLFAPGDYFFTGSIVIKKSITLMGMNHNAILHKRNAETALITINESADDNYLTNAILEKLYFKADGGVEHQTGMIYAYNVNGLYITRCGFIYEKKSAESDKMGYVHLNGYVTNALMEANVYNTKMSGSDDEQKITVNCEGITGKSSLCVGASWNTVTVFGKSDNMSITYYGLYGYKEVTE